MRCDLHDSTMLKKDVIVRRLIIVLLLISMLVTACGGSETPVVEPTTAVDQQQMPPTAVPEIVPTAVTPPQTAITTSANVAARVNGVDISLEAFNRELNRSLVDSNAADQGALAIQILDTLIEQELINQGAAQMGITVTDEEVAAEIEVLRSSVNDISWEDWLANNQMTEDGLRVNLYDQLLTSKVIFNLTSSIANGPVQQVRARHILVATEIEANQVIARLQAGEDFAAVAAAVSLDVLTKDAGGELGWFTRNELTDNALSETAFALQPGEVTGPVVTQLGFHIIQTLEFKTEALEPDRIPIIQINIFENWLSRLHQSATIERFAN